MNPPPGTIGILSGDLSRYTDFWLALRRVLRPEGSEFLSAQGSDIVVNMNNMVELMEGEWLWILGDDHVFDQNILIRLLSHDTDVVVPLCLKRSPPYHPVVYKCQDENGSHVTEMELPAHGLHEVWAAGTAGMLVRKRVLDAIPRPVFTTANGSGTISEDLMFCRKIRDAGFKIHVDVDAKMGHISNMVVWPEHLEDAWHIVLELGNGVVMPIRPVLQREPEEVLA